MFDVGLMEVMIILIIALLVIGPERMPEVARKIGALMGKTKRFVNSMKENSEMSETLRELQSSLNLEDERKQIEEIHQVLGKNISDMNEDLNINEDLGMDDSDFNLDDLQRPFSKSSTSEEEKITKLSSQFNKAPVQPEAPQESAAEPAEPPIQSETATITPETTAKQPQASATEKASTDAPQGEIKPSTEPKQV